ncbi:MAG TPA: hypothetical protein VN712_02270 [Dermatophilaceae bacterium]|nr:hypothetical protein [Dermatophilaceae bacterium]
MTKEVILKLQRTTLTVMCHEQREQRFDLDPIQTRVVYFPIDGCIPHVVYLCPGCTALHRAGVDVAILDRLCESGAPSDWPVVPDDISALDGLGQTA